MHDLTPFFGDILSRFENLLPALCLGLLGLAFVCAVARLSGRARWAWGFWCCAVLLALAGRLYMIPTPAPLSDESEQMLAALTVVRQGRYFGQVLIGTHGPLVTLPLVALYGLGLGVGYAATHVLTVALQVAVGILLYRIFLCFGIARLSALAVLPYFAYVAFALHPQLTTYNAEIVASIAPLFGLYALLRYRDARSLWLLAACGCSLGLVPHLKIQFLPHVFVLGLVAGVLVWREGRGRFGRLGLFAAGAALPSLALAAWGLFDPAIGAYYRKFYAWQAGYLSAEATTVWDKLNIFKYMIVRSLQDGADGSFLLQGLFVPLATGLAVTGATLYRKGRARCFDRDFGDAAILLALLAFSLYAVIAPGRAFVHYLLAVIPVIFLLYGLALHGAAKACPRRFVAFFVFAGVVPLALASLAGTALHAQARKSELGVFSPAFLETLQRCTGQGRSLLVTNPQYGLYIAAQAVSPLPEVTGLFDFKGRLAVDRRDVLDRLATQAPDVLVDVPREAGAGSLARDFPELAGFVAQRYTPVFQEKEATIWCRMADRLSLLDRWLPCSVTADGFGDIETDTSRHYQYRWTVAPAPAITFAAAGETARLTVRLLSPLFEETVTLVFNGAPVRRMLVPRDADPRAAATVTVALPTVRGANTMRFELSRCNAGADKVLPGEDRLLGVQVLEATLAAEGDRPEP